MKILLLLPLLPKLNAVYCGGNSKDMKPYKNGCYTMADPGESCSGACKEAHSSATFDKQSTDAISCGVGAKVNGQQWNDCQGVARLFDLPNVVVDKIDGDKPYGCNWHNDEHLDCGSPYTGPGSERQTFCGCKVPTRAPTAFPTAAPTAAPTAPTAPTAAPTTAAPTTAAPTVEQKAQIDPCPLCPGTNGTCEGVWSIGVPVTSCQSCPEGGFCPGGNKVYPTKGYWSPNSTVAPKACRMGAIACPGVYKYASEQGYKNYTQVQADDVAQCTSRDGYTGVLCADCKEGYSKSTLTLRCSQCGRTGEDETELAVTLTFAALFFVVISLGGALLKDAWLDQFVSLLMLFQQSTTAIRRGLVQFDASSDLMAYVSFLNFDIEFTKPGCALPRLTFSEVFTATVIMCLLSYVLAAVGCLVRALFIAGACREAGGTGQNLGALFRDRFVRMVMILSTVVYLQMCLRVFQGLNCISVAGKEGMYLAVEPGQRCWAGAHSTSGAGAVVLLFVFVLGCPAYLSWRLWGFFVRDQIQKPQFQARLAKHNKRYGYLWRNLRSKSYWFRMLAFPLDFALALINALTNDANTALYSALCLFTLYFVVVVFVWPFERLHQNIFRLVIGAGNMFIMMGLSDSDMTALGLGTLGIVGFGVCVGKYIQVKRGYDCGGDIFKRASDYGGNTAELTSMKKLNGGSILNLRASASSPAQPDKGSLPAGIGVTLKTSGDSSSGSPPPLPNLSGRSPPPLPKPSKPAKPSRPKVSQSNGIV